MCVCLCVCVSLCDEAAAKKPVKAGRGPCTKCGKKEVDKL